jgi:hypothetical protein
VFGGEEELVVMGDTDAVFQIDTDDSKSQSGSVFYLNGEAVRWKSSKKDNMADSTMEAEYIVASEAGKEVIWIKKFVSDLDVFPNASSPMYLIFDNSGAIAQAKDLRLHKKSKHVLQCYYRICKIIN